MVEDCGVDSLTIEQHQAKLIVKGSRDGIDLAVVFVEGLSDCQALKLSSESVEKGRIFTINGFKHHKKGIHKLEKLDGFVKKISKIYSDTKSIDTYELTIGDGDSIERGYSGSAIVCDGFVVAVATDRNTNGKQAYAVPIGYLGEIWEDMPDGLFVDFQELNPYKGLFHFTYEDRENYFGREKESKEIADRLKESRFFTLLGASGSGKSSLLFAGILPLIRDEGVAILDFRPQDRPFRNLANIFIPTLYQDELLQIEKKEELTKKLQNGDIKLENLTEHYFEKAKIERLYIIIDQFEELFTLTKHGCTLKPTI